jgi:hypothetical protein
METYSFEVVIGFRVEADNRHDALRAALRVEASLNDSSVREFSSGGKSHAIRTSAPVMRRFLTSRASLPERPAERTVSGYYTLRWIVYNGDIIGTYGVHVGPGDKPYGASRDFHKRATAKQIEGVRRYQEWLQGDMEGDSPKHDGSTLMECNYHDGAMSMCDGSSLVEVTFDDKKAYMIAAMMAERW